MNKLRLEMDRQPTILVDRASVADVSTAKDQLLNQVECLIWKMYDEVKDKLRIKIFFFTFDISDVLETKLIEWFGVRPTGC